MIEPVFDRNCFKILGLFSLSPGSRFRREELKEKTRLNNVTLDKALARLVSSRAIKVEKGLYGVDFESENARKLIEIAVKQYKELREIPFDVFLLLVDLVDALSVVKGIELYLFGSYAKLIYREKSDVDIAVILERTPKGVDLNGLAQKLERAYGKHVQVHDFEKEAFYENRNDPLIKDILRNGIKLL